MAGAAGGAKTVQSEIRAKWARPPPMTGWLATLEPKEMHAC
jgi:hypothetical protein